MKLKDYFHHISNQKLSDTDKLSLFDQILAQRSASDRAIQKSFRLSRKIVYASLTAFLGVVVLGFFVTPQESLVDYALFRKEKTLPINGVAADQVGRVLKINGEFSMERDGKIYSRNAIFDGDKIILKPGSKMLFDIDEGRGEIIGPAIFTVYKVVGGYRINLLEGNFFQFDAVGEDDRAFFIETNDLNISIDAKEKEHKDFSLKLLQSEGKTYIKNDGDPLLVHKKTKDSSPKLFAKKSSDQTLETSQVLLVQQDSDIILVDNQDTFVRLLAQNEISYTLNLSASEADENALLVYDHSSEAAPIRSGKSKPLNIHSNLGDTDTNQIELVVDALSGEANVALLASQNQEEIKEHLEYVQDEKKVPTEAQLSYISAMLNRTFLLDDMEKIYRASFSQDEGALKNITQQFFNKLNGFAQEFDLSLSKSSSITLSTLAKSLASLYDQLQENYYLPSAKIQQLQILVAWMNYFSSNSLDRSWEDFSLQLPVQLQFN